jgi:hypothetical protein
LLTYDKYAHVETLLILARMNQTLLILAKDASNTFDSLHSDIGFGF